MKACPLKFSHPSEAQQLDGIGSKICDRLTEKLKEHCEANGLPPPKKPRGRARKRLSGEDLTEDEEPAPAKKPRKMKEYVPSLRSGPYALILALSSMPEDSLQTYSKAELVERAQTHCDSSFTVPSEAGKFYTAWNSMTTLVNKDLVQEKGRPLRKYTLTEEGWDVAKSMRRALQIEDGGNAAAGPKTSGKTPSNGRPGSKAQALKRANQFLDLDDLSELDEISLQKPTPSDETDQSHQVDPNRPEPSGKRLGGKPKDKYGTFSKRRKPETTTNEIVELLSSPVPEPNPTISWVSSGFNQATRSVPNKPSSKPFPLDPKPHTSTSTFPQKPQTTSSSLPTFTPIILQPGTFTVHLVLDNREVRAKDDRDYISDELTKRGAPPLLRPLPLGDFLWVAKLHDPSFLRSHGEEGDEVILDYILERKRLDDLISSITDGRFSEQKFRLRKSGIRNVIYLIETFSLSTEKAQKYHAAITSAIASTKS